MHTNVNCIRAVVLLQHILHLVHQQLELLLDSRNKRRHGDISLELGHVTQALPSKPTNDRSAAHHEARYTEQQYLQHSGADLHATEAAEYRRSMGNEVG
jgi:hypothetical protein